MSTILDVERTFNIAGSIPFVQIPSGALRATLGSMQSAIGAIVQIGGLCGESFSPGSRHWIDLRKTGQEHLLHGNLNAIRGTAECLFGLIALGLLVDTQISPPGFAAMSAGFSLLPLAVQLLSKHGFNPRIHYDLPGSPAPKNPVSETPASGNSFFLTTT